MHEIEVEVEIDTDGMTKLNPTSPTSPTWEHERAQGADMIRTQGLTHLHLVVRDLETSLRFYREVFGMEERFRDGPNMVFLNTPGSQDLLTLNEDPKEASLAGVNGGVAHMGFRLTDSSDLDRAITEVEAAGGKLVTRGEHAPGVFFAYVEDPDGYVIEL